MAEQTAEYLQQLRNPQFDKIQFLSGGPVFSNFLFKKTQFELPHGPIASDHDLGRAWTEIDDPKDARVLA